MLWGWGGVLFFVDLVTYMPCYVLSMRKPFLFTINMQTWSCG
jgi:hypothetical protein